MTQQMLLQSVLLELSTKYKVPILVCLHLNFISLPKKADHTNGQVCFDLSVSVYYFIVIQACNTCVLLLFSAIYQ